MESLSTQVDASHWTPELRGILNKLALDYGFSIAGVSQAAAVPETASRLEAWIEQGNAGEMEYLKRRNEQGRLLRGAITVALPWARSVVVCALNYNAAAPRSIDPAPPNTGWIARYAWNGRIEDGKLLPADYHDDLLARLRAVDAGIQAHTACTTRCYVDTGPILERDFAARAGIGWIGKNTCVLNQELGSWFFLGVIVTSLDLPEEDAPLTAPDRCGSCTRCIDACPTDALIDTGAGLREMDASLCISYLTIEKKGSIPEELRAPIGRQVFGCDICQDVCPWNRKAPIAAIEGLGTRDELVNPPLAWLAELEAATYKQMFKGSPLERTKLKRLHRNTAIAMGNSGDPAFLPQLKEWAAQSKDDSVLAEAATWAIAQVEARLIAPTAAP